MAGSEAKPSFSQHQASIADLQIRTKRNEDVMALIVIVLFVGFILIASTIAVIVIDTYHAREDSYELLRDQTIRQNMLTELIAAKLKVTIPQGI